MVLLSPVYKRAKKGTVRLINLPRSHQLNDIVRLSMKTVGFRAQIHNHSLGCLPMNVSLYLSTYYIFFLSFETLNISACLPGNIIFVSRLF